MEATETTPTPAEQIASLLARLRQEVSDAAAQHAAAKAALAEALQQFRGVRKPRGVKTEKPRKTRTPKTAAE